MKFNALFAVLFLGLFLLVGCNDTELATLDMIEGHEEEIADAVDKVGSEKINSDVVHEAFDKANEKDVIAFAKCLTEKGTKLYTASWCGHCQDQKEAFGEGLEYLDNTECALDEGWAQECTDAGVKAVPTWIFADGTVQAGNTPLVKLASLSGCTY